MFARGNNRQRIYFDRHDYERYEAGLATTIRRYGWHCLAYCLMPNHLHLLIETPEPNLGAGMQRLQGEFARSFNDRHGRVGHVFGGRYGAVLIGDDAQMSTVAAYIAANPVEAGLCADAGDWPWSSHARCAAGAAPSWADHERLLGYFAAWGRDRWRLYSEALAARLPAGPPS